MLHDPRASRKILGHSQLQSDFMEVPKAKNPLYRPGSAPRDFPDRSDGNEGLEGGEEKMDEASAIADADDVHGNQRKRFDRGAIWRPAEAPNGFVFIETGTWSKNWKIIFHKKVYSVCFVSLTKSSSKCIQGKR